MQGIPAQVFTIPEVCRCGRTSRPVGAELDLDQSDQEIVAVRLTYVCPCGERWPVGYRHDQIGETK